MAYDYDVVRNAPVARFYYKGSHSHPVRRTVLVIETTPTLIRGYELRTGSIVRPFNKAPVRSYTRSKIATIGQCGCRLRKRTPKKYHEKTTFSRNGLLDLVKEGV